MIYFLSWFLVFFIFFNARADETCGDGYTLTSTDNIAYFSMLHTRAGKCDGGYVPYVLDYDAAFPVALDLPMKCDSGYYYKNGTCVAYETGPCDSGFVDNASNSGTMFDYTYAGGCTGGMEPIQTSHSAMRLADTIATSIQCGTGYYYKNGACVAYEQSLCKDGYFYETPIVQESTFDVTHSGKCLGGYDTLLGRDYASYVVFSAAEKCGAGEYPTGTGCAAHPTENCPDNYYAITPLTAFKRTADPAECGTNYSLYYDTDFCRKYLGANMASVCTPQLICTSGGASLRTSTGIVLPIYDDQVTAPVLKIRFENGHICNANMVPGAKNGTINMRYNNETYHLEE